MPSESQREAVLSAIEQRYWSPTPEQFQVAAERLSATYPGALQRYELCRNDLGESIEVFRFGQGALSVLLLARVHGHEPAGTCGLLALMDGLLSGRVPGSCITFAPAKALLEQLSIECVPMANPDAARRFAAQVSDSYAPTQFASTREDSERYMQVHSEPGLTLNKRRPPHFTPEEVMAWRQTGKPLGTVFDEQGVELWRDWAHGRSMQVVALRELLRLRRPGLFVDIHTHEQGTQIFRPTGLKSEADRLQHEHLGLAACEAMRRAGIACVSEVPEYIKGRPDLDNSTNWAYLNAGSRQFLLEVDGGYRWQLPGFDVPRTTQIRPLGREQMVMAVWYAITAMLSQLCGS
jgi:hypothetical protein